MGILPNFVTKRFENRSQPDESQPSWVITIPDMTEEGQAAQVEEATRGVSGVSWAHADSSNHELKLQGSQVQFDKVARALEPTGVQPVWPARLEDRETI